MQRIRVKTHKRTELVDITRDVEKAVASSKLDEGICYVYVPHTTASVVINEHADPDVASDAQGALDRLVPDDAKFRHAEGNSDSHIKTMLTGTSQFVFVEGGKLALGRWQGIFLAEFDGPREREVWVRVVRDS